MVSFDPETNCVEAFDASGYVDVFIDGAFYSRCDFLERVKVHLVLKPSKDVGTLDNKNYTLSNNLANTEDRHVGSGHSVPITCQRQENLSASIVTGEDASSTLKEITPHGVSRASSLSENEDVSCDQEVEESTNNDWLTENGLCPSLPLPADNATKGRQVLVSKKQSQSKLQDYASGHDGNHALCTQNLFSSDDSDTEGNDLNWNVQDRNKYLRGLIGSGQPRKLRRGKCDASQLTCKFCGKTFVNTRAMNAHRQNPYCEVKCVTCNSIYSSKGSLFKHYCRVHPNVQDLKEQFGNDYSSVNLKLFKDQKVCPLCMIPLSDEDCVKHFDSFHFTNQTFLCCVCGQDFSTEDLWNEHYHKDHGQQDTATGRGMVHYKKKSKRRPYRTMKRQQQEAVNDGEESREHQCKYCKKTFSTKFELLSHPRRQTVVRSQCKQCSRFCRGQAELIIHEQKIHGPGLVCEPAGPNKNWMLTECPLCSVKVRYILMHIRKKHTKETLYVCCVCGKACLSLIDYTRHCNGLHTVKEKGLFQCSICNKTFDNASDSNSHSATHRKICIFCGEKFLLARHLERHYLEKHEDSLIPCNHCNRKFPTVNTLRTHKKYIRFHAHQPCPKCGLMLRDVRRHLRNVHPDVVTEAQCNICGKKVKDETRLRSHMQSHTNDKLSCSLCFKVYKHKRALASHLRIVHFLEKKHECPICGKKCSRKSNLRVHMRIHSYKKMFPCRFCDQGFNYKASLLSHMRSKHPGIEAVV